MKKYIVIILILIAGYALADISVIPAFNSGELSPKVEGRTDIQKYYSGLRTCENLFPKPQGNLAKRPGSYYIYGANDNENNVRLIEFEYATSDAFVLEFSDETIRFYTD